MNPDTTKSSSVPIPEPAVAGDNTMPPIDIGQPTPAPQADPGATPAAAADSDRIEQEWVDKTKQIVLATRNDPYEQARQLATLKADYMMKRYNKEIKVGE